MRYLVLVSLIWSFSFGIIKYELTNVDPFFISYSRNLIALIFFTCVSIYQLKKFKWDMQLIFIGAIQFGLMYIFYTQSYQYFEEGQGHLIATFTITTPIFVSIADKYFFKNKFTYKECLAIFLVILGSYLMRYNIVNLRDYWHGFLLIQCANFFFAFGQILFKNWNTENINSNIVANFSQLFLGATLITFISYLLFGPASNELTETNKFFILFLGLIASGIGFLLWNVGTTQVSSKRLAIANNLVVPLAVLILFTFWNEEIYFRSFLPGIALFYIAYRIT